MSIIYEYKIAQITMLYPKTNIIMQIKYTSIPKTNNKILTISENILYHTIILTTNPVWK